MREPPPRCCGGGSWAESFSAAETCTPLDPKVSGLYALNSGDIFAAGTETWRSTSLVWACRLTDFPVLHIDLPNLVYPA
jgi:hypothetical protein